MCKVLVANHFNGSLTQQANGGLDEYEVLRSDITKCIKKTTFSRMRSMNFLSIKILLFPTNGQHSVDCAFSKL